MATFPPTTAEMTTAEIRGLRAAATDPPTLTDPRSPVGRLRAWAPGPTAATAAIVACAIAYAFVAYFARRLTAAGIAPATVAFARFSLIAVVLGRFLRVDRAVRSATWWGIGSGAAMSLGWIAYIHAIDVGSVAGAGVVYMTYPLFTLATMLVVFGVRPTVRQLLGGLMVLIAAVIALGVGTDIPWIVVLTPATFGGAIAVLTERLGPLDPFERIAAVGLGAALVLVPLVLSSPPDEVVPATTAGWLWMIGLAAGSTLVPMTVYASAAPQIGGARAAVAGAIELPAVILVGVVLLGETLGRGELLAAVLICTAVVITPATRPAHAVPGEDTGDTGASVR
jgi:drug/metabolite transporter (DMT)-like permease